MGRVEERAKAREAVQMMKQQVSQYKAPPNKVMEDVFEKYFWRCKEEGTNAVEVKEDINWKSVIMSLPAPQPSRVLGCGLRRMWLKEYDCVYDGLFRFHAERLDGSFASFDYRDAYRDAYHSYFNKSFKDDVEMALRSAILHHLIEYKENQTELISDISGKLLTWEQAVVQHYPASFKELTSSFLNEVQQDMETIKLEYDELHVYVLTDKDLLRRWQMFHLLRASYRIVGLDEAMEQPDL